MKCHALVPAQQQPKAVVMDGNTTVRLKSRRLFGLPLGCALPDGVPESIDVDLSAALRMALAASA